MDFDEMRNAMNRALGNPSIQTKATGTHIETIVLGVQVEKPQTYVQELIQRLMDHQEVTKDPITKEAAVALRYESQQLQLNLARMETAIQILADFYEYVNELGDYSRNWSPEMKSRGADKKLDSTLDACRGFLKKCSPWTI